MEPAPRPSAGAAPRLSQGLLPSRYLPSPVRWRMALPSSAPARRVVIALHGYGASADMAFDVGVADSVETTQTALVAVDGGRSYWHARADGSDTGAMVREELIPLAVEKAGLPPATPVNLMGWSMGGFGALLIASDLGPQRVHSVVAISAALWLTAGETAAGAFDGQADFEAHTIFGRTSRLSDIPLRIDCGTTDPFVEANRQLVARLPHSVSHFTTGGHDFTYWTNRAADQMRWIASA